MTRLHRTAIPILLAAVALGCAVPVPEGHPGVLTRTVEVGPLTIDGLYRSMDGPAERRMFDPGEVKWITGFRTEVVDAATGKPAAEELFCHSQLQLDTERRLLVNAMGIADLRFPDGFGLPLGEILEHTPPAWRGLTVLGMVLNNHEPALRTDVRIRVSVDYVSEASQADYGPIRKLYKVGIPMSVEDSVTLVGDDRRPVEPVRYKGIVNHWMVAPGKQIMHKTFDRLVPVPSRVHLGVVHLHNHGRSMRIVDTTDGRELWRADVVYENSERVQIESIPVYSSQEGFLLHPDRGYLVETYYDNTSAEPVDAMGMMYLYFHPLNDEVIVQPAPEGEPMRATLSEQCDA